MFNLAIDKLFKMCHNGAQSGSIIWDIKVNIFVFADGLIVLQNDLAVMFTNLHEVSNYLQDKGMVIYSEKCAELVMKRIEGSLEQ